MSAKPLVVASRLTKRFGNIHAVTDVSFALSAGTITGFLGANGAGKSTTMRMMLGLVVPSAGTVTFGGRTYAELSEPSHRVGAVLEPGFHPSRSAAGHLRALATAAGLPLSRVDEVLQEVGLAEAARRRVGQFSLGMRQRLALAGALLGRPEVLILDEPANGLDPDGIRWLRGVLRHFRDAGGAVLVSSHVLAEVAAVADELVVIAHGRIVRHGLLGDLLGESSGAIYVRGRNARHVETALVGAGLEPVVDGDGTVVRGATEDDLGSALARAGVVVHEMRRVRSSVEDLFFELTGDGANGQ